MKHEHLKCIGMMICAAALVATTALVSFGEGLTDLPDLTWQPTPRIPSKMLIPPRTDTTTQAEARHAAMLDATRGTKGGLIAGRQPTLNPISLTDPDKAAKRLQPPAGDKPELMLKTPAEFPKLELVIEALTDELKGR